MFGSQQKIKNPLLKQLGQKNINQSVLINSPITTTKEKKLDLENLLQYIKNFNNNVEDTNNILEINNKEITNETHDDPKNGEYINFICNKKNIKEITDGLNFKRYGVLKSSYGKLKFYNNLSLLSSLMSCINDNFIMIDEQLQLNYLKSLKLYIYNTFTKSFYDSQNYKELTKEFNFDRIQISKNLFNYDIQRNEFLVISDIFHINLFIFDIGRDKLFFTGIQFIPYKKNIFLIKKEDGFYEPLYLDNSFIVDEQHDFIQYLIENNSKVDLLFKNDKFNIFDISQENLDKYSNIIVNDIKLDINNKILERRLYNLNKTKIDEEKNIDNNDDTNIINDYTENKNVLDYNIATEIKSLSDNESNDQSDDTDSEEVITTKYNKTDLKKMKLLEIMTISKSMGIILEYEEKNKTKKKTKDKLIEEILQK